MRRRSDVVTSTGRRGTAASSAWVYGCVGAREHARRSGPCSTTSAVAQHDHVVAQVVDDAEVVGHEHQAELVLVGQPAQQVEDLHPHRHVERADRLVADEQRGPGRDRPGDGDALLLAAGELVRVALAPRRVEPDRVEHLGDAGVVVARRRRGTTSGSRMIEAIVIRGSSELSGSWSTICASRRNQRSCARPARRDRPAAVARPRPRVARSSPSRMRTSVDLPEPDSPTMPRLPPSASVEVDAAERACARRAARTATCGAAR